MNHKLEADGILLEFGLRKILSDIFISCETGRITGILGRNGEGKTCLMNIIYGTLEAASKSIRFDESSIPQAFRYPSLIRYLPQFNFMPKSISLDRIFDDFELSYPEYVRDFPEFNSKYSSSLKTLSGGERRLVEVYVIIKSKSQFAMLDEPFTHLMPLQIEKVKEILKREKSKKGFLVTDHIYKQIVDISDDLYLLSKGKTHLTKSIEDLAALGYARF
ncbi:MAG: ATP-binding cassette domain-containing protein [Chitinophagales bacterium]